MGEVVEVGGGWSGAERPPPTFTNLHQPPPTSSALLNPLPVPRLASPHGPDRAGGADHARERCRRSEEHTSELQSPCNLVCRLLLEKKKQVREVLLLSRCH